MLDIVFNIVKIILQVVGLATIIWFIVIAYEEYVKIKEKENGPG